jgi:hypothetical protein
MYGAGDGTNPSSPVNSYGHTRNTVRCAALRKNDYKSTALDGFRAQLVPMCFQRCVLSNSS